ncbi:hypothetical protein Cantr_05741 [Candida viswanathii]|uniref:Uncharacterized protein n=1 Tax=Candida viswanathii TaxID=5486 RepID=A0A367XR80_9ASCO|nr:hypothetical protein Cantr_05741 [Candida viswanathii]
MLAIPLLQYIKENSREENVQLLPSLIRYAKSVTIFEAEKHSDLPVIPRDISYQDFISSLVTELVLRKSHNALVSGYKVAIEDNNVTTACINFDGNFLPTSLNDANWHRIFVLVGQEKFLNLLINYKGSYVAMMVEIDCKYLAI